MARNDILRPQGETENLSDADWADLVGDQGRAPAAAAEGRGGAAGAGAPGPTTPSRPPPGPDRAARTGAGTRLVNPPTRDVCLSAGPLSPASSNRFRWVVPRNIHHLSVSPWRNYLNLMRLLSGPILFPARI